MQEALSHLFTYFPSTKTQDKKLYFLPPASLESTEPLSVGSVLSSEAGGKKIKQTLTYEFTYFISATQRGWFKSLMTSLSHSAGCFTLGMGKDFLTVILPTCLSTSSVRCVHLMRVK